MDLRGGDETEEEEDDDETSRRAIHPRLSTEARQVCVSLLRKHAKRSHNMLTVTAFAPPRLRLILLGAAVVWADAAPFVKVRRR